MFIEQFLCTMYIFRFISTYVSSEFFTKKMEKNLSPLTVIAPINIGTIIITTFYIVVRIQSEYLYSG